MAPRRTSGAVRSANLARRAVLVKLPVPLDEFFSDPPGAYDADDLQPMNKLVWNSKEHKAALRQYFAMERKGYIFTDDGCVFPEEQYRKAGEGQVLKGHQRYFQACYGFYPSTAESQGNPVTDLGWPADLQLSHSCHRRGCLIHLLLEWKWRNVKRNYCGVNGDCDCSNGLDADKFGPPCALPYRKELRESEILVKATSDRGRIAEILTAAFPSGGWAILPYDHYEKRDLASAARMARKRQLDDADLEELGEEGEADEILALAAEDAGD